MPPRLNWNFRLRRGWRSFVEGHTFTRRPVSVTRQRVGSIALGLIVAAFGTYVWTTRDEAIRRRAIDYIERAVPGGVEARVGSASFGMFEGIMLYDVLVATPYSEDLDPGARDIENRRIFYARSLHLRHNPWLLLTGRLRVESVLAVQPKIQLSQNTRTGARNWQLLREETRAPRPSGAPVRPSVTLRDAELIVTAIDPDGERHYAREKLDADLRPHPVSDTGYFIEVRRYSHPVERTTVLFDPGERVVANTPFVEGRMIRLQLPPAARRLFEDIDLEGEARLARMMYDQADGRERDVEIELRNVRCNVPIWLLSGDEHDRRNASTVPREERLIRMVDARGRFKLRGDAAELDVSGLFNGAKCRFTGGITNVSGGLAECGFDIAFHADGLPMPEGDVREAFVGDDDIPWELRRFFYDYDPRGNIDFDLRFLRQPKEPDSLTARGFIRPRGGSLCVRWFPFPIDSLDGQIRIVGPDVFLENLSGRHGSGYLTANAAFDARYDYAEVDLDVKATAVPLDTHLYLAMPDRYQAAWRLFRPQGTAHIHTRMKRAPASDEEGRPPWINTITIDLVDAQAALPPYPYPIEHLNGRLEVDEDRILIRGLTGMCRGSSVRIDGYAILDERASPEIELRIEGDGVRLDDAFGRSLPPEGRGAFTQFQPDGFVDVLGAISMHDNGDGIVWDLRTRVRDTQVVYEQFPYRLDEVEGEIDILPDRLSIRNLAGQRDEATLTANGDVVSTREGVSVNVAFNAVDVDLNEHIYAALPPGLKSVWDLLRPSGRVRIRTGLHMTRGGGHEEVRHRTDIEPIDANLCFREFPLPLSGVQGKAVVTGRRVEILHLTGAAWGGTVELSGHVDLDEPGTFGTLSVFMRDMPLHAKFLDSLPPALARFMKSLNPSGTFDLALTPLRFEQTADGGHRWIFDAVMTLRGVQADFGFRITGAQGALSGRCTIDENGRFGIEGDVKLSSIAVAGWELQDFAATLHTREKENGERLLELMNAEARFYGGEAVGFADVQLDKNRPRYQANITVRDAQLNEYLASQHRRATASMPASAALPPPTARGSVDGRLNLRGRGGGGAFREGTGELFISRAQVWKLPLILAIFQVLNLTPDENVFHDGRLEFSLYQDELTLQSIDLQGRAMSFVGVGTVDLATDEMDITLLAGSPLRIRVPLLTEFLEGASREIMELRVTGTPSKPDISPQPLKSLTKALKTLFPETPPAREKKPPVLPPMP